MTITYDEALMLMQGQTLYHQRAKLDNGSPRICKVDHVMIDHSKPMKWFSIHARTQEPKANTIHITPAAGRLWGVHPPGAFAPDSWQGRALRSTAGSRFGCMLHAILGVPMPANLPEFGSSASVTSDGHIIANFRSMDGRGHMGAHAGTWHDLWVNVQGLAKFLDFTGAERTALEKATRAWVALDYSGKVKGEE